MNANELADKIEDARNETDFQKWAGQAPDMLRQQQAEIEALKDFAIWMTGCGYDFCQHDYFNKCRDELFVGKAKNEQ